MEVCSNATYQVSLKYAHWFQEDFKECLSYMHIVAILVMLHMKLINIHFLVPESLHTKSE